MTFNYYFLELSPQLNRRSKIERLSLFVLISECFFNINFWKIGFMLLVFRTSSSQYCFPSSPKKESI